MKNIIYALGIALGFSFSISAQVNPHAIGIRGGGGNYGNGAEISYQHGMGDANRLELDLGWRGNNGNGNNYSSIHLAGIYHWDWNITEGLNWFVGPGAVVGLFTDKFNNNNDGVILGVGGQIGIEYDFNQHDVPLLLALDTRPMWRLIGFGKGGAGYGGALSLRYTF